MQIHKLKPYHILDCEHLNSIQSECIFIIQNKLSTWQGDTWIDSTDCTIQFYKQCSSLREWLAQNNWKVKTTAITYIDGTEKRRNIPPHIDQLPVLARINIPILNCDQATVNLYKITEDYRNKLDLNKHGYCTLNPNYCVKTSEYILTKPIVFNTQIPHSVDPIPNAQYPRIMLTLTLFNDILHYLK